MNGFSDEGITPQHTCKFKGACMGMICIGHDLCLKSEEELTEDEKQTIESILSEIGCEPELTEDEKIQIQKMLDELPF